MQWLAHKECELGDGGSNPRSRHYSIGRIMAYSPICRFAPLDDSLPGSFAPWLVRPLACSPPGSADSPTHRGRFAPWLVRPRTWYHCDTTNQPVGEQARGEQASGESSKVRGRISQGANKPGGDPSQGAKESGANRLGGETAKGRKSQIPLGQVVYSHCLSSFSAPRNWGYKKEFSAHKWWWLSALD